MSTGATLEAAILATVAYCDVFAFAPYPGEIHRFLVGRRASRGEVEAALGSSPLLAERLGTRDGLYFLAGKGHLAPRRLRFSHLSASLWPSAREAAAAVARTGLARCGMVTGSLAADNADEHADVDFLFIYPAERAYLSYAGTRLMQRLPSRALARMCPNYALPDDRLQIRPQSLFTAWEIAKAVPMFGHDVYLQFIAANAWVRRYLPNALPHLDTPVEHLPRRAAPSLAARLSGTGLVRRLEAAESARKRRADERDVGVDMSRRLAEGSVDRHSPTRSYQALSELRYRMEHLGLEAHPLYAELAGTARGLEQEMVRWGPEGLVAGPAPERGEAPEGHSEAAAPRRHSHA